jgi:hypothetical protein
MAERIILHIGAPKTGTTFLQAVLFHNQQRLADAGVLVPGRNRRDHGFAATGVRQGADGPRRPDWERIVAQAREWPGTVVLSNEWFCMAGTRNARRALRDLSGMDTHILFTARDFVSQIPAAWQETLKLGVSSTLEDFVASLDADRGRWRWSVLDPALVLERWQGWLPAENMHVVTLPVNGSDPSLLWKRFARVCGIEPDFCETQLDQARESISVESARLLQQMGPLLRDAVEADSGHWSEAYLWIQQYLSHGLLVPRRGSKIAMPPEDLVALRERSRATVRSLAEAGYDIVGDLHDLTAAETPAKARPPEEVTDREMLEVAMPLVADLLGRVRRETRRANEAERQLREQPAPQPAPEAADTRPPSAWRQAAARCRAALSRLRTHGNS